MEQMNINSLNGRIEWFRGNSWRGGTPALLGGRVLFAVVTLEDGVGAPDVAFTGVACTLKFCRDSFSNCTRQNFLKFCQLVRNGESGRFTLMTRNDWNNPSMVFWAFFPGKIAKMSLSEKKWIFSKLTNKLIFCVGPLELSWNLVYIRRNRWQIAFPILKKTHFKVRPASLFFCKRRTLAKCTICVRLPRCRLSDRFWAGEKKTTDRSFLVSVLSFVRVSFLVNVWVLKHMKIPFVVVQRKTVWKWGQIGVEIAHLACLWLLRFKNIHFINNTVV